MPVSERRLNLRYIKEHLEQLKEAKEETQTVTANKPLVLKQPTVAEGEVSRKPSYTAKMKSRK